MKIAFKNVFIDEIATVHLRNGGTMKLAGGTYHIAGINYTPEEIAVIYSGATRNKVEPISETRNVQHEIVGETRKHETQHETISETRNTKQPPSENAPRKHSGKKNSKFIGMITVNGIEYESAHQASFALNIAPSTVLRRCRNKVKGFDFSAK